MTADLRLVVFDVDGTLVDSQADILAAMAQAFAAIDRPAPVRASVLEIVGLSLPQAMARLAPDVDADGQILMVDRYKSAYAAARVSAGATVTAPLYPGAREVIEHLSDLPGTVLGIATGKSRRGLDHLLDAHGLRSHFLTTQVADYHPSKPHPAMLQTALDEAGVAAAQAVMIGDTGFDMEMAQAAGVPFIGVGWGYHPPERLTEAESVIGSFEELPGVLENLWGERTG